MGDRDEREPLLNGSNEQVNGDGGPGKQYIVRFEEDGDPDNPLEWSKKYRWFSVALLCLSAAVVYDICNHYLCAPANCCDAEHTHV